MSENYSNQIKNAIEDFFAKDEWTYDPIDENGVIRTGIQLQCKLRQADIFIAVEEDCFSVYTILPIGADEVSRPAVSEFITRANYGTLHGCFEMNFTDGEIGFHTTLYCGDAVPTYDQVETMICINFLTVDRYGDALIKVMYGLSSPEAAIQEMQETVDG